MRIFSHLRALAVAVAMIVPPLIAAQADTWFFPAEVTSKEYTFGNVHAVVTMDSTKDQQYPTFLFTISEGGREIARYPGIGFETLLASPDNQYFVGLSNSGIPGTAVIIFNARGEVLLLARHDVATFDYCRKSVTLNRVWYDGEKPEVEFKLEDEREDQGIYLRSCRGTRIELFRTVIEAYARTVEVLKSRRSSSD